MGIEDSLYFEDVTEGQQVPSFTRAPNLMEWNRYAAVNDEFVYIHMDVDKAQAAGMKDVFGMGNLRLAYLHNMLRDWIGVTGDIRRVDVQHRSLNYKDEKLICKATVTKKYTEGGENLVDLDLEVENPEGKNATPGTATVALPSRG